MSQSWQCSPKYYFILNLPFLTHWGNFQTADLFLIKIPMNKLLLLDKIKHEIIFVKFIYSSWRWWPARLGLLYFEGSRASFIWNNMLAKISNMFSYVFRNEENLQETTAQKVSNIQRLLFF